MDVVSNAKVDPKTGYKKVVSLPGVAAMDVTLTLAGDALALAVKGYRDMVVYPFGDIVRTDMSGEKIKVYHLNYKKLATTLRNGELTVTIPWNDSPTPAKKVVVG